MEERKKKERKKERIKTDKWKKERPGNCFNQDK